MVKPRARRLGHGRSRPWKSTLLSVAVAVSTTALAGAEAGGEPSATVSAEVALPVDMPKDVPHAATTAPSAFELDPGGPFSLRALLDLRVVRGSKAPSWQEDGPGKLRYGGLLSADGSFERVVRFAIAQLALEPVLDLPHGWRARAQVNWDGDVDEEGNTSPDHDPVRIVEGYVRRDWSEGGGGAGLRVGLSNPPFSLEHVGPARTPRLSLTPSALTSWLWEEGRVLGVEAHAWRVASEVELSLFGGFGWGPDQQGILLARRGWVLSDFLSGANSRLPIRDGGGFTRVFDERDGRPAIYAGASLTDPAKIATVHAGYYDNLGDLAVSGVWETRYGVAGLVAEPLSGLEIVTQFLYGTTTTRGAPLGSVVAAFYPLVSYRWRQHRLSARYDDFRVRDTDGGTSTDENGQAYSVAYLFEIGLRHRLAVEYVTVDGQRRGIGNPGDDGWQVSYRLRY